VVHVVLFGVEISDSTFVARETARTKSNALSGNALASMFEVLDSSISVARVFRRRIVLAHQILALDDLRVDANIAWLSVCRIPDPCDL
jgi:hypothetical protein